MTSLHFGSVQWRIKKMKFILTCVIGSLLCTFAVHAGVLMGDDADYVRSQIYTNVEYEGACVRLLSTRHGEIGCTSPKHGVRGTLIGVHTVRDLEALLNGTAIGGHTELLLEHSYVALLAGRFLNAHYLAQLNSAAHISGAIFILGDNESMTSANQNRNRKDDHENEWSPEMVNPNESSWPWNSDGDGSLWCRFDALAVFGVSESEARAARLMERAQLDEGWSAELNAFMWATDSVETCLRRGHCDPVGGQSVYAALGDAAMRRGPTPDKPTLLFATRIDAFAFFQQMARGADSALSGMATLVAAVDALARSDTALQRIEAAPRQVMLAFFDAESFGYAGSRRFVRDVRSFRCDVRPDDRPDASCKHPYKYSLQFANLTLDAIEAIVDVQQVGIRSSPPMLHMHSPTSQRGSAALARVVDTIERLASAGTLGVSSSLADRLPPTSALAFVSNGTMPATVVLTDHDGERFANAHYQGRFDTVELLDVDQVCATATLMARSMLALAVDGTDGVELAQRIVAPARCDLVAHIFECFGHSASCSLFDELFGGGGQDKQALPAVSLYASVFRWMNLVNVNSKFVHDFVANATGAARADSKCSSRADCQWQDGESCVASRCVASATYYHDAVSPAFEYDHDKRRWRIVDADNEIGYVESEWGALSMRIYKADPLWLQLTLLGAGLSQIAIVYAIYRYIRTVISN
jgi:nicastrin